ncbi:MAG TPA: 2-oxoacid:ferredoxin oxidoreductase subunit gamma [Synergistaceae bacterium]|jgi:2-oxoglutarate ferredoxin oxidoreductase subunit gamma|nr:MAG: Pyruvate/ketoisovalerate oxidoreductase, catalytic domain protein [Synergistales bacterium 57_84]KUK88873.1 MAG: Pyruvate/ketoisovalerate oxidoreductase, catalytic domain protein [Synergistales bacterium 58_81]HBG13754.1 2-oxoacid:ferredoxin oxidoreductase subunit gamma [Synergistaceae bacterium]HCR38296.1 2-oxoacid:ferredoxin oxidoreductase subunit gamma [Synergistaceae bacterium]HQO82399.1 2-oxoacid:acceptor oxidoreductase family protein [Synergistales bacterium]
MSGFFRGMIAAGFGGQGIMVLGQLVAYTAISEGRHVTWIPSYGPEMRGGTANCCVAISDEEIASPVVAEADVTVIMNNPSMERFEKSVKPGGLLIYNSDLVTYPEPRKDVTVFPIPAYSVALSLGSDKVSNIVVLGVIVEATDLIGLEACIETIKDKLGKRKPQFLPMNLEAFEKGRDIARGLLKKA